MPADTSVPRIMAAIVLAVFLATAASMLTVSGATATAAPLGATCPAVTGQCGVDAQTHCPTAGPLQPEAPDHCESIPGQLVVIVTNEPGGGCVQNDYVQVQVPPGVEEYEAVWYSTIGLGTRWWDQSEATEGPESVTGEGATYQVPVGSAAWSGAGGAGGTCSGSAPEGTYGVAGWGVPTTSCGLPGAEGSSALSLTGGGGPLAYVGAKVKKKHCTSTYVKCPNGSDGSFEQCFIRVTDVEKHPVTPTGKVNVVVHGAGRSGSINVTVSLKRTPGGSARSAVVVPWFVLEAGEWTATAHYLGDSLHKKSEEGPQEFSVASSPSSILGLKQNLKNIAAALGLAGSLVIMPAADAGAAAVGGYYLLVSGTGLNYLVTVFGDPPDPEYRVVATPDLRAAKAQAGGGTPLVHAARTVMADGLRLEAFGKALHTTIDRASSAGKAGNQAAKGRQVHAASRYLKQMAGLLERLVPDQAKVAKVLTQEGLATDSTPLKTLQAHQARLAKKLPPAALKVFRSAGLDARQIGGIQHEIAAAKLQSPANVAEAFVSPSLTSAERGLASNLRELAKNPLAGARPGAPPVA
ncbi:MAG: hypothetical protein JSU06_18020 [Actinobacteria bacterium]|nr:hypothetical protein [Actinomycetota bacterium]